MIALSQMNTKESIMTAIKTAENMYNRLILLVGEQGSGKTILLQNVSAELNKPILNVNLELSKQLLCLSTQKRKLEARIILANILESPGDDVVLLDNTEILFDPTLSLDPLRLLQNLSRNRTLVVSWNGFVENKSLIYANSGHPEYKKEEITAGIIIEIPHKKEISY